MREKEVVERFRRVSDKLFNKGLIDEGMEVRFLESSVRDSFALTRACIPSMLLTEWVNVRERWRSVIDKLWRTYQEKKLTPEEYDEFRQEIREAILIARNKVIPSILKEKCGCKVR